MSAHRYLAIDLGAESGRVMQGVLNRGRLALHEIHRFANKVVQKDGHLCWDMEHLEREIFTGIEKAASLEEKIDGLSTDSWGVDYVLVDGENNITAPAFCYRDSRHHESPERFFQKVPFAEIYAETGIQLMSINTLYQFETHEHDAKGVLAAAGKFLLIGDYFNARFGGRPVAEASLASTTQIYNPTTGQWSEKLISALGLPASIFPPIVPSGTAIGPVSPRLAEKETLAQAQVVASCSHDTGAAVVAVPAEGVLTPGEKPPWAYLSSGTWSLLGAELAAPLMTNAAREAGFTNEVGIGNTIRFLKNIAGLWVVQECRRAWEAAGLNYNYDELTHLARENGPAAALISLKDPRFLLPGGMPEKIAAFCRETGQPVPNNPGQFVRTILDSLALTYADTLRQLETVLNHKFSVLHIVGGGAKNELLNELTASATGLPVIAGPVEGTAIGNVLIQALALGHIKSMESLRLIVRDSFPVATYKPGGHFSETTRNLFQKITS